MKDKLYTIRNKAVSLLKHAAGMQKNNSIIPIADNKCQKELLRIICSMAENRKNGQPASSSDVEVVKAYIQKNIYRMTTNYLDSIEQFSLSSGLFVLALAIRIENENMIQRCANAGQLSTKQDVTKLFWIYINNSEDDAATQLLNEQRLCDIGVKESFAAIAHIRSICSTLNLMPKDTDIFNNSPEHSNFAHYVMNKGIAIIGPSSSGYDHSEEVKRNFDIIIRMNYRGTDSLTDSQRGLLPQISYYRIFMNSVFSNPDENISYLSDLDFVVLRHHDEAAYKRVCSLTNARVRLHIHDFYFSGNSYLLQMILQDLLFFKTARIKVFNSNCYLTDTMHDAGYYAQGAAPDTVTLWSQYASHNLISQYNYLRQLYKRRLIEADERLSEVLELGTAEYIRRMEKQENGRNINC